MCSGVVLDNANNRKRNGPVAIMLPIMAANSGTLMQEQYNYCKWRAHVCVCMCTSYESIVPELIALKVTPHTVRNYSLCSRLNTQHIKELSNKYLKWQWNQYLMSHRVSYYENIFQKQSSNWGKTKFAFVQKNNSWLTAEFRVIIMCTIICFQVFFLKSKRIKYAEV